MTSSYLYINNCQTWDNDASKFGAVSTLTVMEVTDNEYIKSRNNPKYNW